MKLSSVFVTSLSVAVSALTALGFSSQAQALTFSGKSSGAWGEPTPGSINTNPIFSGVEIIHLAGEILMTLARVQIN